MAISYSQQEDYQLGLSQKYLRQNQGAYYDYSDPDGLNIKVSVWGYVKYPGRYIIPQRSDIRDLISYSGGISDDSYLDEIRVYKVLPDSTQQMLQFDYEDLWWNEESETRSFTLQNGSRRCACCSRQTKTLLGELPHTRAFNCRSATFLNNFNCNNE